MNTDHRTDLPAGFDPSSRVWIYQGHRPFSSEERTQSQPLLKSFIQTWASHGTPVKGHAGIYYDQFIILMADETASGVSGCSTDSSVHLIKQIEQQTGIRFFDRLNLAFHIDQQVRLIPLTQLPEALSAGIITTNTLYFDNTIRTKEELELKWPIPLKDSWLGTRYLSGSAPVGATSVK
jgi:hypothetical protein